MIRSPLFAGLAVVLCCRVADAQETPSIPTNAAAVTEDLPYPMDFDPDRFLGKWFEVARMPNAMQPPGTLATAEYSAGKEDGQILVQNKAFSAAGKLLATIKGKASLFPGDPPRLAVSFGPITTTKPNYYVMHVDKDYQVAVVGTPNRKSLWILSRDVPLPAKKRDSLIAIAGEAGFDTSKLVVGAWKAGLIE